MNLITLFTDAAQVLRLRFRDDVKSYQYDVPVYGVVLLALGAVNAASAVPIFGSSVATFVFMVGVSAIRWVVLAQSMSKLIHYYHGKRINLMAYTLLTESLLIPSVLAFYIPEAAFLFVVWGAWIFWAQAIGFFHFGKLNMWKIVLGYLVYAVVASVLTGLLLMVFSAVGWFDVHQIYQNLQTLTENTTR